jgi:hypothetical protein
MNSIQTPIAIRTTAAALAVFMTVATLNSLIGVAEPQHSALMAQTAARGAARIASAPIRVRVVAQAPIEALELEIGH